MRGASRPRLGRALLVRERPPRPPPWSSAVTGCNVEATAELASQLSIPVIASGGIRDLDDIRKLLAVEDDGVTMAILGRSLYEGTLDFTQALDLVEATEAAKDNQANNEG